MRNDEINFDEIIEGIQEAQGECVDAEDNFSDFCSSARDASEYADNAKEKLESIERVLDSLMESVRALQQEAASPSMDADEVRSFIVSTLQDTEIIGARITDIKSRCISYANGFGFDITVADVFPDGR